MTPVRTAPGSVPARACTKTESSQSSASRRVKKARSRPPPPRPRRTDPTMHLTPVRESVFRPPDRSPRALVAVDVARDRDGDHAQTLPDLRDISGHSCQINTMI